MVKPRTTNIKCCPLITQRKYMVLSNKVFEIKLPRTIQRIFKGHFLHKNKCLFLRKYSTYKKGKNPIKMVKLNCRNNM